MDDNGYLPIDVWIKIGSQLEINDIFSIFRIDKHCSKLAGREDLWCLVFLKRFGDWTLDELPASTWKIAYRMFKFWQSVTLPGFMDSNLQGDLYKSVLRDNRSKFYVRAPGQMTFFLAMVGPAFKRRPGDVLIYDFSCMKETGLCEFVGHDGELSILPPVESCWPHKPLDYCRVGSYVYLHLPAEILELFWRNFVDNNEGVPLETYEFIDPRKPEEPLLFKMLVLGVLLKSEYQANICRLKLVSSEQRLLDIANY